MSKNGCAKRAFKIVAATFAGIVGIVLVVGFVLFLIARNQEYYYGHLNAQEPVRRELGCNTTSNEYYCCLFGGLIFEYRCNTTSEAVQTYVLRERLHPISDKDAIRRFRREGSAFWWNPGRGKYVEYYGYTKSHGRITPVEICKISFDRRTGISCFSSYDCDGRR